ncbi:unnamed protein product [Leptosia nina]|uniref:Uncharacterized protein n=1 Tax=Leptosia nina TaxID=320188 RepID=A0AAV1J0A6_9NEOP
MNSYRYIYKLPTAVNYEVMMICSVYYYIAVLCFSLSSVKADSLRYYYDYECNEPLLETAKLTATSSLRERGPDNAKLYGSHMV